MNKTVAYLCIAISLVLLGVLNSSLLDSAEAVLGRKETAAALWKVSIPVKMSTLNPQEVLSVPEKSVGLLVFSRLVNVDEHSDIQPDVLESWSYDLTLNRYYFKLKENLFFHDGRPLNSDDVIFSIHQWARKESLDNDMLHPIKGAKAYSAGKALSISGVVKLDARIFAIDLEEWVDHFIKNLSNPRFCLYPDGFRGQSRAKFFEHPIGTGPYRLTSYEPGAIKYEAHAKYHGGEPRTPRIEIGYETPTQAFESYNAGKISDLIMYDVSDTSKIDAKDSSLERFRSFTTFAVVLNGSAPSLRSRTARHSVAKLLDKERIIRNCYPGASAAQSLIPPGMLGSTMREPEELDPPGNAATANGEQLVLYIPEDINAECLKGVLADGLRESHIKTKVVSFREMYELLKAGKLAMWIEPFEFKNEDPIGVLQYFSESSNEFLLGMRLPELQEMFGRLGKGLTSHDRARLYREIDEYMVRHHHVIPLLHPSNYGVYRKSLRGIGDLRTWRYVANWHKVYRVE